ncbi:hypothetical protein KI387_000462, partial [Taxus chinensis]
HNLFWMRGLEPSSISPLNLEELDTPIGPVPPRVAMLRSKGKYSYDFLLKVAKVGEVIRHTSGRKRKTEEEVEASVKVKKEVETST